MSDDESIVLKNLIWANYEKGQCKTVDLHLHLESGHLFIVYNNGGDMKIRSYKCEGRCLKEVRKATLKKRPKKYEGICIDLNLQKEAKK